MGDFRLSQGNSIRYLESTALAECDFLLHAFCTRHEGLSRGGWESLNFSTRTGDEPGTVSANWGLLAVSLAVPLEQFLTVHQVHGDAIHAVDSPGVPRSAAFPPEAERDGDALITDLPGIALAIKTADCVPIFLVDRVRQAIGAVHAGWRGTAEGIAGKAVAALESRFSSRPGDILAAIGPAIGPCCYEVDEQVFRAMSAGTGLPFFRSGGRGGRWMLDLAAVNRRQLEERGIPPANISVAGLCTSCLPHMFFSHRRDGGKTGRHANVILLRHRGKSAG